MSDFLDFLAGELVSGGCEHCDAEQFIDARHAPIYRIEVRHDEWCPVLSREVSA